MSTALSRAGSSASCARIFARSSRRRLTSGIVRQSSSVVRSDRGSSDDGHLETLLTNSELLHDDAINELRWIREHVSQKHKSILAKGRLPPEENAAIGEMVIRRSQGEPLQYILGDTDFGPITILCKKPVLIPRPETAHIFTKLSEYIISLCSSPNAASSSSSSLKILDLCTGSGCISLLLSHYLSPHFPPSSLEIRGIDNSPSAITLANANVSSLKMNNVDVKFKYGNLFSPSFAAGEGAMKVDMVVSNPPYIPHTEYLKLPHSVRKYESPSALLGDGYIPPSQSQSIMEKGRGLMFYERITQLLPSLLSQSNNQRDARIPRVALEVGHNQAPEVEQILIKGGLINRTEVWNDQYNVPRMVLGWIDA